MRIALAALLATLTAAAPAQTPDQAAALARASTRGALLYAYDQAAWHGTDDMLARLKDAAARVGGYIVDGPRDCPRLVFFDKTGRTAVYVARFKGTRLVEGHVLRNDEDRSLSAEDARMIAALTTAQAAIVADPSARSCTAKPFNTVVLPPDTPDGPVPVYFLTPRTTGDTVPFGGHYEVDVDATGRPGPVRRFTNGCLDIPVRPALPKDARDVSAFVSHLLDPVPTEIHVFSSLALGKPVMVGTVTQKLVWPVNGATIGKPIPLDR